nr:uncharacterized protein LOC111506319 [Leptinotarsa decemlineata]
MDKSNYHDDILKDVTDEELEDLKNKYKHQSMIPMASNALHNAKKLREKGCCGMTVLSPGKGDGTVFISLEYCQTYQLAVFTLDETGDTVYESLTKTKRIKFERTWSFYAIHSSIYPVIERVLESKNMKVKCAFSAYTYSIPKEEAILFNIECPEDMKLGDVEPRHSKKIHSGWSFKKYPQSYEFVCSLIENNGGVGLFLKSTDELVAWVLKSGLGELGLLHTSEKYRSSGFASIVMKQLSKQIAQEGQDPETNVILTNGASNKLMKKLGFKNHSVSYYFLNPLFQIQGRNA